MARAACPGGAGRCRALPNSKVRGQPSGGMLIYAVRAGPGGAGEVVRERGQTVGRWVCVGQAGSAGTQALVGGRLGFGYMLLEL